MAFIDQNEEPVVDGTSSFSSGTDMVPGMDINSFLSRPVNIKTLFWDQQRDPLSAIAGATNAVIDIFDPWTLFLNQAQIKYKLNNFAFLRGKLHVKFIVSSQPFFYGAALASYYPLPTFDAYDKGATQSIYTGLIPQSQRPHVWLLPQDNAGGELVLPFFYPQQYINITSAAEIANLGAIKVQVANGLRSANGVVAREVNVQVYAWMTEVELHGSTVALAVQSKRSTKDEYDGPISGPASAVAAAAGALKSIPAIAPLATAAQIGASAVAKVSSLFGYSNTPIIDDVKGFKPSPFPHLASPEISFPVEKLTLDPKGELSIDPGIVGLPRIDELNIKYIAGKESLIDIFNVPLATEPNDAGNLDLVWTTRVNPDNYTYQAMTLVPNSFECSPTPASHLAKMFAYWRGDLIYRFVVIASKFHKGRLRVMWDPQGQAANNICTTRDSSTVVKNAVIDISETTEFEFRVPYSQPWRFLQFAQSDGGADLNGPFMPAAGPTVDRTWRKYDRFDNGMLAVRIFNKFTAPDNSADVQVQVFVRCADNIEFAAPREIGYTNENPKSRCLYTPQSLMTHTDHADHDVEQIGMTGKDDHAVFLEHMGEKITNLRQIIRRANFYACYPYALENTPYELLYRITHKRFPGGPGYVANNFGWQAKKMDGTGSVPFSWAKMTTLFWISQAFIGHRGSINWTYNAASSRHPIPSIKVNRRTQAEPGGSYRSYSAMTVNSFNDWARFWARYGDGGSAGLSLTNTITNAGMAVSVPMYNMNLFESTSRTKFFTTTSDSPSDSSENHMINAEIHDNPDGAGCVLYMSTYVSAGSDFTFLYYINAPTFWVTTSMPIAT